MPAALNKLASKSKALTANQKIAEAIRHVDEALNFQEVIGHVALRKALENLLEIRHLSPDDMKNELVDALCNAELAAKKIELYEVAFLVIKDANVADAARPKGGRPKNPWAIVAYEHAKLHLSKRGRLPTAKLLSKTVCQFALSKGYSESATGDEAFSVSTARDYLSYFKNSLPVFNLLTAEQWFSLFDGDFASTKYFGENLFPS